MFYKEGKEMTCKERLEIVLKPYLTAKDIARLFDCSSTKSQNILKVVKEQFPKRNCIFGCQVKTEDFLNVYELRLEDFIKNAELESKYLRGG